MHCLYHEYSSWIDANLKNKCDIPCVVSIFLTKRLVCVNLEVFSKSTSVIWNIEAEFRHPVVGCVILQWTKSLKQCSFFQSNYIINFRHKSSIFSQLNKKQYSFDYEYYHLRYYLKLNKVYIFLIDAKKKILRRSPKSSIGVS